MCHCSLSWMIPFLFHTSSSWILLQMFSVCVIHSKSKFGLSAFSLMTPQGSCLRCPMLPFSAYYIIGDKRCRLHLCKSSSHIHYSGEIGPHGSQGHLCWAGKSSLFIFRTREHAPGPGSHRLLSILPRNIPPGCDLLSRISVAAAGQLSRSFIHGITVWSNWGCLLGGSEFLLSSQGWAAVTCVQQTFIKHSVWCAAASIDTAFPIVLPPLKGGKPSFWRVFL